jgi:hypothetical protein
MSAAKQILNSRIYLSLLPDIASEKGSRYDI